MILADIYVAGTGTKHDFWLDENATVKELCEEIGTMLSRRELSFMEPGCSFLLCSYEKQQILPGKDTLEECGICNGSRLLFL